MRNLTAFNNVIRFRLSAWRVPALALDAFSSQMTVVGPMGRTVEDVAMLLSVQAGYDDRVLNRSTRLRVGGIASSQ
ncbi:amidase family protein [Mesorhizobium sp. M1380]|uniref:amidase family protein n=1 Tax=Mesorhizobium sp. M1380 TaxID=2957093 RepID=UPI003336254A